MKWAFGIGFLILGLFGANKLVSDWVLSEGPVTVGFLDTVSDAGFTIFCLFWAYLLIVVAKNGWHPFDYINFMADWVPPVFKKILYVCLGLLIIPRILIVIFQLAQSV